MTDDRGLPPLGAALAAAGIVADRRLGQNFLLDLNICRKIVRLAEVPMGSTVIEVGPGPGGLTRALIEAGFHVVAVERDDRFLPILRDLAAGAAGRLSVVQADALRAEEAILAPEGAAIVANLPYNVGTALLVKWLTGPFRPHSMTLMFQAEVAARIVAPPGGSDYGRLSVLAQALCACRKVLDLPPRAFTPPPKVASAVVRLVPLASRLGDADLTALETVTRAAFGQRRKMLRTALRGVGGEALCAQVGIEASLRAEQVPVAAFIALAQAVAAGQPLPPSP